jgi:hypothetical protein
MTPMLKPRSLFGGVVSNMRGMLERFHVTYMDID